MSQVSAGQVTGNKSLLTFKVVGKREYDEFILRLNKIDHWHEETVSLILDGVRQFKARHGLSDQALVITSEIPVNIG